MSENYQVFARKYRPRTFDDVLGQDHVVQTLKNAIEQDRLAHAYLFVGPRGTGKTSTARILAKALNCPGGSRVDFDPDDPMCREIAEGNSLDVLEIDGASNNGVEQVRELRDKVMFAPSSGRFKIYYIDEVHMLTTAAFNALLKTLEEPPAHVKFIFATTEPQKILPTIISRCQRFDLRRIPTAIIAEHLKFIAKTESVEISEGAAYAIAKGADGGMRDAQSMLDQMVAFCGNRIEESDVLDIFGFNSEESVAELADAIITGNNSGALDSIQKHSEAGKDLSGLLNDLISYFRNVLVRKVDPDSVGGELSPEIEEHIVRHSAAVQTARLLPMIDQLAETDGKMKWAANKKLHMEIAMVRAIQCLNEPSLDDVIALVAGAAGGASAGPVPVSSAPPQPRAAAQPAAAAVTPAVSQPAAAPQATRQSTATPANGSAEVEPPKPLAQQPMAVPTSPSGAMGPPFWEAAKEKLIAERPLFGMWLEATHFLEHNGDKVVIGFARDQRMYRESLMRHENVINQALSEVLDSRASVVMEVRDDLSPIVIEDDDEQPAPQAQEPQSAPPQAQPTVEQSSPAAGGEPGAEADDEKVPEDFYDDPLINEAVEIFDAKIKK